MKKDAFKKTTVLAASVLLIILDQVTKGMVQDMLKPNGGQPYTLVVAGAILAALFLYKHHSVFSYVAAALLLAGGVGNLIDRIVNGYVVDFIHVMFFGYIFNIADCCVTIGACFLVAHYLWVMHQEKQAGAKAEEGSGS